MTTTTHPRPVLPARQVRWTRLGAGMGYTNTEPKRAAIRAAVEAMMWVDPAQLSDLTAAAVEPFSDAAHPASPPDGQRRLIGLQSVTGERYVLLDLGYEAIDLLHDTPLCEEVGRG